MPFITFGNTVKVELIYNVNGQVVVNVLWFKRSVAYVQVDLVNLINAIISWRNTYLKPIQSSAMTLQQVIATDQSVPNGLQAVVFPNPLVPGTAAGAVLPNNVAAAIKFVSPASGRSARGRAFLGAIVEADVTDDTLGASYVTAALTAFQNLNNAITVLQWKHVIASKFSNGQPRLIGLTTDVTAYGMNNGVDTQRRRLR